MYFTTFILTERRRKPNGDGKSAVATPGGRNRKKQKKLFCRNPNLAAMRTLRLTVDSENGRRLYHARDAGRSHGVDPSILWEGLGQEETAQTIPRLLHGVDVVRGDGFVHKEPSDGWGWRHAVGTHTARETCTLTFLDIQVLGLFYES